MQYTDTRDNSIRTDLKSAVLNGMSPDTGGLYIPVFIPNQMFKSFVSRYRF